MKYIQTLLTFWSAVGFGPIFDCDIKTNNQTCTKQIKSEILLTRNLYLYVPSTISRIWCNSKTALHAMLLQWYMIIYVFPVFCKYWLISEIYLLLLLLLATFAKKWALGEKAVCKLYVGNMAFFTWYDIVIPSRTPTDHPGIPFSFSPGSNSRPKGPFLA